ncbi:DUF6578 domain-containing protein [Nocardioides lianchengensis]|uniref:DUF6578 domain-containing protein n=1 Tax=Nocardioides lianchengensis TaxID=1045774 RepID=UPI0027BAA2FC|nr:DUF6578 domain-containing protein [Nocardioides lianchengensis]
MATVWVSVWQMECCGAPFSVGDRVVWTVNRAIDDGWLSAALGPEMASRISHSEEHHDDVQDDLPEVSGRVLTITRAWGVFGPQRPGDQVHVPVPGSHRFLEVSESGGFERHAFSNLTFNGWIVELDRDD